MFLSMFRGDLPARLRSSAVAVGGTCLLFLASALVVEGMLLWDSPLPLAGFYGTALLSLAASAHHHYLRLSQAIRKVRYLRSALPDGVLVALMVASARTPEILAVAGTLRSLYAIAVVARNTGWGRRVLEGLFRNPAIATVVSFAAAIVVGTILLAMPRATLDLQGTSLVDAFFTAVSATCVTGLAVVNTHADAFSNPDLPSFSTFGQIVLLLLIQFGGLGIMTLSAIGAVVAGGGRVSLRDRRMVANVLDEESPMSATGLLRSIVVMTLAFEAAGAMLLAWRFRSLFPDQVEVAAWFGLFHSVSAFCNAGFSLFGRSMVAFRTDPVVNLVIGSLIVAGGLGFTVIAALFARRTWRGGVRGAFRRLPVHARLVLVATAGLLLCGTLLLLWLDADGGLAGLPWQDRLWAAGFQAVSARTAGFNTIDLANTTRAALIVYLFLMFVGASPGGTGGGIKTTTFSLLLLSLRATLRNRDDVVLWGRSIGARTLMKVSVVTLLSFVACLLGCLVLLATQAGLGTEALMFETVSAFGTVGLSMGITPGLDGTGKMVIACLMYLGRIGPLTLTLAIGQRKPAGGLRYPGGRVIVG